MEGLLVNLAASGIVALLVILLAQSCNSTHSHPPSAMRRVGRLMSDVKAAQTRCYASLGRYCTLEELALPQEGRWGQNSVKSGSLATLDEYDLRLTLGLTWYCVGAVPDRFPDRFHAFWRDETGKEYDVAYPWTEIPPACDPSKRKHSEKAQ